MRRGGVPQVVRFATAFFSRTGGNPPRSPFRKSPKNLLQQGQVDLLTGTVNSESAFLRFGPRVGGSKQSHSGPRPCSYATGHQQARNASLTSFRV